VTRPVAVTDRTGLGQVLRDLKLSGMLQTLDARLAQAHAGDLGHLEFLQVLCEDEISRRQSVSLAKRLRRARFEQQATLEGFDLAASPKLPAAQIHPIEQEREGLRRQRRLWIERHPDVEALALLAQDRLVGCRDLNGAKSQLQGSLQEAANVVQKALQLAPTGPALRRLFSEQFDRLQMLQKLEGRLEDALNGSITVELSEKLLLGELCGQCKRRYLDAARLYKEALEVKAPTDVGHLYFAATDTRNGRSARWAASAKTGSRVTWCRRTSKLAPSPWAIADTHGSCSG
jgi:tetratricopeptide (TPR) repeat protein